MSVPATNAFGPLFILDDLEDAVIAKLKLLLPVYVRELERRKGREIGAIPALRSWTTVNDFDQLPGGQLPGGVVISPGIVGAPEREGNGVYSGWYQVGIALIVPARDRASANAVAKLYVAATTGALFSSYAASLDGVSSGIRLVGQGYGDARPDYLEIGAVGHVIVDYLVSAIVEWGRGPASLETPTDLGQVQEVDIDALARRDGVAQDPDLMHLVSRRTP